jgi:hypothetical protein
MNAVRREDVPVAIEGDGVELRKQEIGGNLTVAFVHVPKGADFRPALVGLPDDLCQCPHWGYVISGKVEFTFADGRTEAYESGDAYYAPPGHTPRLFAGSEVVEFHPTSELAKTMEVVQRNMEAAG